MTPTIVPSRLALAFATLVLATSSYGAVVITPEKADGVLFSNTSWASSLKNNDLINTGQSTLSSASTSGNDTTLTAAGLNNGNSDNTAFTTTSGTTWFRTADFTQPGGTAFATFNLNISVNALGYDITSIQSFMGYDYNNLSRVQGNQTYTVAVHRIGEAPGTYNTNIATVSYTPFLDENGPFYESHVTITENSTGVLASGVDSIRFSFLNPLLSVPQPGTGTNDGTVIRELDVYGAPTAVPEPSSALLGVLGFVGLIARRRRA